ncbi:MAG: hypothetical protein LBB84_04005 [Tannerellaceae bacterium]|jgi:hypothetical protein|nr:hypothetical protein [Tannerellaceae bacterium]
MKKKELCIVCLLFVFCRCGDDLGTLTFSGQGCIPDVADKYRYPANDPKKQISYAQSQEERCQVPASEVKKMSTFGLIRTLLDAPCLSATSLMLSSDLSSINRRNNLYWYNAAKELVERKEAAHALLTFYNAIHFDCVGKIDFEQLTDYEQKIVLVKQEMDFFVHLATLELLFSEEKLLYF